MSSVLLRMTAVAAAVALVTLLALAVVGAAAQELTVATKIYVG